MDRGKSNGVEGRKEMEGKSINLMWEEHDKF
jgi:hypothetical protein